MSKDELRQDIAAAKALMHVKFGGGREIKKLEGYLLPGEQVQRMTTGSVGKGIGLVVMTDQRLLVVYDGITSQKSLDFPYSKLSGVQWSSGMMTGTIALSTGLLSKVMVTNVDKVDGRVIADELRLRLADKTPEEASPAAPSPAGPTQQAPSQVDVMDQLRKLGELRDAGVVTDEEFAAKKADLLGRL